MSAIQLVRTERQVADLRLSRQGLPSRWPCDPPGGLCAVPLPSSSCITPQVTSSAGAPYTLYLDLPAPPSPPPPTIAAPEPVVDAETDRPEVSPDSDAQNTRIGDDVRYLKALYCPCAGFAFNSLTGGRNVFVSEPQVGGHGGSQAH